MACALARRCGGVGGGARGGNVQAFAFEVVHTCVLLGISRMGQGLREPLPNCQILQLYVYRVYENNLPILYKEIEI